MYDLFDKCILFLFCLLLFPFDRIAPMCVFACLLAVSVSAGCSAFPGLAVRAVFPAYTLLLLFFPQLGIFLPLLAYDVIPHTEEGTRQFPPRLPDPLSLACVCASLFLCAFFRRSFGFRHAFLPYRFQLLLLLSGVLLAFLLRRRTVVQLFLGRQLFRARDDGAEIRILLEERNRSLLEKQDNEIYTATLRERNRIAREIHDNVGHMLARAILMVGALKATCRDPASAESLGHLGDTLDHAMNSIRSSVHDLHDSSVNLEDSLYTMAREFSFCPVSVQFQMSPDLPREIKYSLIAIAREALVNISRHSNATEASITAIEHPGFYQFIIRDNGDSADPPDISGIGLENISARVSALKGSLQIRTSGGFCIYITIPHASSERSAS